MRLTASPAIYAYGTILSSYFDTTLARFSPSKVDPDMALDPYSPCPCGSGKKLKFCCNDLASDIEKIHKMISGEQPHAALKHLDKLLQRTPHRASLLDIRASIELSMHDFDAAQQTIEAYLKAHPKNGSAHAQNAILLAATAGGSEAVGALQTSLEFLANDEMPLRVLESIGAVGHALLLEGEITAARAHLLLYAAIAPSDNNEAVELLLRMNLQAELPLLLREYLQFPPCPPDVDWQERYDEAGRFSSRGLWRRAEASLAHLRQEVGDVPEIVYALSLMRGWLGDKAGFSAGLHEYARLSISLDNAAEAEALAQLVNPTLQDPILETVKFVYPIDDIETLHESLISDQRVEDYPLEHDEAEEATRPRSTHVLLDRPKLSTGVGIQRDEIPHVIAFLSVYGKRTDRDARLEVTTDRDEKLTIVQDIVREIRQSDLHDPVEEEVIAEKSLSEDSLSWRWRLPNDTPPELRRSLLAEERRSAILERWATTPRAALGNKSPQEAIGDPELHIALVASALIIEQAMVDPDEATLFHELRETLQLAQPKTIDPQGIDLETISLVRIPRIDLSKLTINQLTKLLDRTLLTGAGLASLFVATALVQRADTDSEINLTPAYRHLIRKEPSFEKAHQWVSQARAWAEQRGDSQAEWALLELELSIEQHDAESARKILREIQDKYANDPDVAEATYRLLYSAGLLSPAEEVDAGGTEGQAFPPPKTSLWTPDQGAADSQPNDEKQSAIWTP